MIIEILGIHERERKNIDIFLCAIHQGYMIIEILP
jgi:hypothetical protein